jgi:DNA-binding beta-propeller fold protein YncE
MKHLVLLVPIILAAQTAAPPPGRGTDRPPAAEAAKLKTGPAMNYTVQPAWPTVPKGMNLGEVSGVDVDRNGNVWVFNRGHWPVMQFDRGGHLLQSWSAEQFPVRSSHGMRVGPDGSIWAIDVEGHVVFKLNQEGKVLMVLGNRQGTPGNDSAEDAFNRPTNVAFRANGDVYVSDGYVNSRVIEFNPAGEFVRKWGTKGTGDGQFNLVHDVQVDQSGKVYVADRLNERIQVFDADGKYLTQWNGIGAPWGIYYVPKQQAFYMCDGKYNRILKLNMEGQVVGRMSGWGKAPGKVDYAHSIAVDPADGSIYVAEIKNWRVQKWTRPASPSTAAAR